MSDRLFLLTHLDGILDLPAPARDMAHHLLADTCLPVLPGLHVSAWEGGVLISGPALNVQVAADGAVTVVRWVETRDAREVVEFLGLTP